MKNLINVRQELAEKGLELTPDQLRSVVNDLKKLQNKLLKHADFCDLSLWDRLDICRDFANQGVEISPDELDKIIEIAKKVLEIRF